MYVVEIKIADVNMKLLQQLDLLMPFGNSNPKPKFWSRVKVLSWRELGKSGKHCSMRVTDGTGEINAVRFNDPWLVNTLKEGNLDLDEAYVRFYPETNEWKGKAEVRLSAEFVTDIAFDVYD